MTNYKELIDTLRDLTHGIVRISNGSVLREAADAIETLTTELAEERHRHDRLQDWDRGMTEKLASAELQCKQINEGAAIVLKKCDAVLEELAQVKAERDAAVKCLEDAHACETCEHMDAHPDCDVECLGCQKDCQCRDCRDGSNFKWRGEPGETAMTNGDRFRHYTDEELVDLLYQDYLNFSDRDGTEDPSTKWCDMKGGCQGEETSECTTELHKACILRWLRSKVEEVTE